MIKFVVLYFAVLPPPLGTLALQILQVAIEFVGTASVKYHQTADPLFLVPSMLC